MQLANVPAKLVLPFADAGSKNTIPVDSQVGITAGAASFETGFPPLTMTPVAAGGVPPSGEDFNGILYDLSALLRWLNAGGGFAYDADFASDGNVNGYPKGARVLRADGAGYWFNTVDNNETDPDAGGAGWVPDFTYGVSTVAMASANVTLSPAQYGKKIIAITGTLTANLQLIFPAIVGEWLVANNTSGAYTITAKTAAGTGVSLLQGNVTPICGDGTNIAAVNGVVTQAATPPQFDNDPSIATTEFVQRALGNFRAQANISSSTTLDASHIGVAINVTASSTLTLPAAGSVPSGACILVGAQGSSVVATVNRAGSDEIVGVGPELATTFAVGNGDTVLLCSNGSSAWRAVAGSVALRGSTSDFGSLLSANGYQKLPSGLIIQWGESTFPAVAGQQNKSATLPVAFPSAVLGAFGTDRTIGAQTVAAIAWRPDLSSTTQVTFSCADGNNTGLFGFIAIGY